MMPEKFIDYTDRVDGYLKTAKTYKHRGIGFSALAIVAAAGLCFGLYGAGGWFARYEIMRGIADDVVSRYSK